MPIDLSRRSALVTIVAGLARAAPDTTTISVNGGIIEAAFDAGTFDLGRPAILEWIRRAAQAVTTFYGKFPDFRNWRLPSDRFSR